jgi:uncharacterized membrane protein (Fun14 family)
LQAEDLPQEITMPDDTAAPSSRWTSSHHNFLTHLMVMPGWHKAVILVAGALALAGTAGVFAGKFKEPPAAQRSVSDPNGSRFVPDSSSSSATRTDDGGLLIRLSPHAVKVGLSVILGFILGWIFRAFLKTMALITLLVVGGLWLLSHFGVLHVGSWDVDTVKSKSSEAASWLQQHAQQLKDLALAHMPSAGGGAFGAFLGFRRK